MTGLAQQVDPDGHAGLEDNVRYAPFSCTRDDAKDVGENRSWSGGSVVLAAVLVLSVVTVAFARGQASIIERYGISQEAVLGISWIVQGGLALFCFALIVRWLRN